MLLLCLIIAWLVMNYEGPVGGLQYDAWLPRWRDWVIDALGPIFGHRVAGGAVLLGPVLLLAGVLTLFGDWFFHLVDFLVSLAVVLYACGRDDYQVELMRYHSALEDSDTAAMSATARRLALEPSADAAPLHQSVRQRLSYRSYDRWFGAACWFLLLGAPGALFYRMASLLAHAAEDKAGEADESDDDMPGSRFIQEQAAAMIGWLDWLPARFWTFGFALVGNFGAAFAVFSEKIFAQQSTEQLIDEVSSSATGLSVNAINGDGDAVFDFKLAAAQMDSVEEANNRVMVVMLVFAVVAVLIF